jgi:hypothetical protein
MSILRADCGNCCGLCCVVPNQLAEQGFPVDKPAEKPCVHLDGFHRCSIYATRRDHGYSACAGFDCFGAGQWITERLFGGAKWSDSPELAGRMFAAYQHWAPRFEAAALIEAALPYVRDDARCSLTSLMLALTSRDYAGRFIDLDAAQLRREILAEIRSGLATNPDEQEDLLAVE